MIEKTENIVKINVYASPNTLSFLRVGDIVTTCSSDFGFDMISASHSNELEYVGTVKAKLVNNYGNSGNNCYNGGNYYYEEWEIVEVIEEEDFCKDNLEIFRYRNYNYCEKDIVEIAKEIRKNLKSKFGDTAKFSVKTSRVKRDFITIRVLDANSEHIYQNVEDWLTDYMPFGFEDFNKNWYLTANFLKQITQIVMDYNPKFGDFRAFGFEINDSIPK